MTLLSRWRDLVTRRDGWTWTQELPFLVGSALVVVVAAQWGDPGSVLELALLIVAAVIYVLRAVITRVPAEVFSFLVLAGVAGAMGSDADLEVGLFLPVVMVLYTAWHTGSTIRAAGTMIVSAAMPVVAVLLGSDMAWTPWVAANVFTFVMGRNLRRQHLLIAELEATRTALAETAVMSERQRIARELHDLAGHTLAAVMLHVTGARHVLRRNLDESERALLEAERVGRSSLEQIRAVVAALRTNEHGTDPALATSGDLTALDELVEEYRRAGLTVCWSAPGELEGVDGPTAVAVHRITREALANVARHAAGNRVEVSLGLADVAGGRPRVHLVVADHGSRPGPRPSRADGFGLIGMGERARGLGGELSAGPTGDGWRVEARLPVLSSPAGGRRP